MPYEEEFLFRSQFTAEYMKKLFTSSKELEEHSRRVFYSNGKVDTTIPDEERISQNDFLDIVNLRIKQLRLLYGFKKREVADAICMRYTSYVRIEQPGYNFDRMTLYKIALFYEVTFDFLFGFTDYPDYRTISLIDDEQISNENIIAITAECLIQVKLGLLKLSASALARFPWLDKIGESSKAEKEDGEEENQD